MQRREWAFVFVPPQRGIGLNLGAFIRIHLAFLMTPAMPCVRFVRAPRDKYRQCGATIVANHISARATRGGVRETPQHAASQHVAL